MSNFVTINRQTVLNLYKQLLKEANLIQSPSNKLLSNQQSTKSLLELLRNEFKRHNLTTSKHCKQTNESFFIGQTYLNYLKSTRENLQLQARYCKGERSIEDAANIVGLRLPKTYDETK